ncbi:hypothetical protein ACU4GD_32160 [Cupriavidus basilensis]
MKTIPAGLLPQIAQSFGVSVGWAGQLVTLCALGSGLAAVPLTIVMRGWRRRFALPLAVGGFFVSNAITAGVAILRANAGCVALAGIATGLA